jgi:hypothetical protein
MFETTNQMNMREYEYDMTHLTVYACRTQQVIQMQRRPTSEISTYETGSIC